MARNHQVQSRIIALMLAGIMLLSAWALPVFAEGSPDEPPGTAQETEAPADPEQGNSENAEGAAPSDVEGEPLNIINPDQPEDTGTGPVDEADEVGPANRAPTDGPVTLGYSSIVAFAPLDADVAEQEVTTGTPLEDMTLPDTLAATVEDEDGTQAQADVTVTRWSAAPEYTPDAIGTYTFTPELAAGYTLESGAVLPEITVRVVMGRVATAAGDVDIDANFPDAVFRDWVKAQYDTDNDGSLSAEEIAAVTGMNVYSTGISDLTGIEHFTALKYLTCSSNNLLTELDVSGCTSLTRLYCSDNNLTELDVSGCTNLTELYCSDNNLTELDVSKNTTLTTLDCSNNNLEALDVTRCTNLTTLNVNDNNGLTKLDVTRCTALEILRCRSNKLTELDVSRCTNLTELNCRSNKLTELDVSRCTKLTRLYCYDNNLTTLNLSGCTQLESFLTQIQNNPYESLTLPNGKHLQITVSPAGSGTVTLTAFTLSGTSVTLKAATDVYGFDFEEWSGTPTNHDTTNPVTFSISGDMNVTANFTEDTNAEYHLGDVAVIQKIIRENGLLETLNDPASWGGILWTGTSSDTNRRIYNLNLSSKGLTGVVDVTGLSELEVFWCNSNRNLTGLKVSGLDKLTDLRCYYNGLTGTLDMTGCTALTRLDCYNNSLEGLDVSECTNLTRLECYNNDLKALDVSECTNLTRLYCNNNDLKALDVSECTNLTRLYCHNNDLKALDVSKNTALTRLNCYNNSLEELDVSKNTALTWLDCSINSLEELDVSENPDLTSLNCASNSLEALDVSECTDLTSLHCASNSLEELDVSENPDLTDLYCQSNNLTSLDVFKNPDLTILHCYNNNLTVLDMTGCTKLGWIASNDDVAIHNNPYESLTLPDGKHLQIKVSPAGSGTVMLTDFTLSTKTVKLTATPTSPFNTVVWTDDQSGNTPSLQFDVTGDMTVTANFYITGNAQTPTITSPPQGGSYTKNTTATLMVGASVSDGGTLSYQWYSNTLNSNSGGTSIPGADGPSYSPPTGTIGTTYYYVEVKNTNPYVTGIDTATIASDPAAVTVNELINAQVPVIDTPPTGGSYTQNASVTLTVGASVNDGGTLSYQWYSSATDSNSSGSSIPSATASSYSPSTATTGTTYYYVKITNTNNTVSGNPTASILSIPVAVTVTASGGNGGGGNGGNGGSGSYTVSYRANGGTGRAPGDDHVERGSSYTIARPTNLTTPSGQRFVEWNTNSTGSGRGYAPGATITMPGYNLTLHAIWEDIPATGSYTITFHPNGGSVSPSTMRTGANGKLADLPTPTHTGSYAFEGWYTAASGGTQITTSTVFTANVTVYAHWRYTGNGGDNGGGTDKPDPPTNALTFTGLPDVVRVGDSFTLTPSADTQEGSDGWSWDAEYFSATFNSPATFTALKEGTTTISYTGLTGSRGELTVTILAADDTAPHNPNTGSDTKDNPQTGDFDNNPWWWLLALLPAAALTIYAAAKLWRRLRRSQG